MFLVAVFTGSAHVTLTDLVFSLVITQPGDLLWMLFSDSWWCGVFHAHRHINHEQIAEWISVQSTLHDSRCLLCKHKIKGGKHSQNHYIISRQMETEKVGCVYLHLDDRSFIWGDAEYGGTINLWGKLWRLVHILHLNSNLRQKETLKRISVQRLKHFNVTFL